MAQDNNEATRVMGTPGTPQEDRTLVAGAPQAFPGAAATQMGATVACPVCRTNNSALETYCGECGFLLASAPGVAEPEPMEESGLPELVETAGGRRLRLKPGANTVGRENCDILLMDGTVSRRHAQITVENGVVSVTDTGSTNGTQVDGQRLAPNQPTPVAPGAVLRFGNASLTLAAPALAGGNGEPAEPTIAVQVEPPPMAITEQTLVAGAPAALAGEPTGVSEAAQAGNQEAAPQRISTPPPAASETEPPLFRLQPVSEGVGEIRIRTGITTIGRRTGNTVILAGDPYVSGRHAEIACDASGCYLTDLGSTNGTLVNGERLEPGQKQLLLDGDEVQIGQGTYRFETLELPEEEGGAGEGESGRGGEEGVASRKSQVASEDTQNPALSHDSRLTTHDSAEGDA